MFILCDEISEAFIKNTLNVFIILADAVGLATFVQLGVDKALGIDSSLRLSAILAGYVTGVGGGVALACSLPRLLLKPHTIIYHAITLTAAMLYSITRNFETILAFIVVSIYFLDLFTFRLPETLIPSVFFYTDVIPVHKQKHRIVQQLSFPKQKYRSFLKRHVKYYFFSRLRYC